LVPVQSDVACLSALTFVVEPINRDFISGSSSCGERNRAGGNYSQIYVVVAGDLCETTDSIAGVNG
jgi:hypothetical protein